MVVSVIFMGGNRAIGPTDSRDKKNCTRFTSDFEYAAEFNVDDKRRQAPAMASCISTVEQGRPKETFQNSSGATAGFDGCRGKDF